MTALFLACYIALLSHDRYEVREAAQDRLARHAADDDAYRLVRSLRCLHPHSETRARLRPIVARWTPAAAERCLPIGCPLWPQIDVVGRGFGESTGEEAMYLPDGDPRKLLHYNYDDADVGLISEDVPALVRLAPVYHGWRLSMKRRATLYLGLTGDFDGLRCALHRGWVLELATADAPGEIGKLRPFLQDYVADDSSTYEYPPREWAAYTPEYLSLIGRLCPDIINKQYRPR